MKLYSDVSCWKSRDILCGCLCPAAALFCKRRFEASYEVEITAKRVFACSRLSSFGLYPESEYLINARWFMPSWHVAAYAYSLPGSRAQVDVIGPSAVSFAPLVFRATWFHQMPIRSPTFVPGFPSSLASPIDFLGRVMAFGGD